MFCTEPVALVMSEQTDQRRRMGVNVINPSCFPRSNPYLNH